MNGMISETLRYEALAEGARSLRHCVYSTPLLLCRFARGWRSYFCCYEGPKDRRITFHDCTGTKRRDGNILVTLFWLRTMLWGNGKTNENTRTRT